MILFNHRHMRDRRGTTVADLLVAATLLAVLVTTMMTITVRSGRMRQQTRQQQLAMDELANQLERLLSLDSEARLFKLDELTLPDHLNATKRVPGSWSV
jgi:Tfp pilus assembly protein PilV